MRQSGFPPKFSLLLSAYSSIARHCSGRANITNALPISAAEYLTTAINGKNHSKALCQQSNTMWCGWEFVCCFWSGMWREIKASLHKLSPIGFWPRKFGTPLHSDADADAMRLFSISQKEYEKDGTFPSRFVQPRMVSVANGTSRDAHKTRCLGESPSWHHSLLCLAVPWDCHFCRLTVCSEAFHNGVS
jgi:hypothetical protein